MATIAAKLQQVRTRIARACARRATPRAKRHVAGREQDLRPARRCARRIAAGQRASARTTCRKASDKMRRAGRPARPIEWHLIGPLQSNKTRVVAEPFDWVHSGRSAEDRRAAVGAAARRLAAAAGVPAGQHQRRGAARAASRPTTSPALACAVAALPRLRLRGLMAIPEPAGDFEAQRAPHRALRALARRPAAPTGLALDTCRWA